MLAPLANNSNKRATSKSASVPAPVKGWNAKDALADMPPDTAVILDNMFPNLDDVTLRRGSSTYSTGSGSSTVGTLAVYAGPTSQKMFSCANLAIYNVSSGGAASSVATGFTNNRWQHTMFSTSGGNFLWMCNGADAPRYYDGSSWTNPSLSGVTATDIIDVMAHQNRLFFALKDSLEFGYLPVVSVAGAVSKFNLAPLCKKGGKLLAMGSWTRDGGSGADDVACFITSEGQVVLYSGTNPADASAWSMIGVFDIGKPIGRRSVTKVGSELVVTTQDGYVPLSQVLPIDRIQGANKALSDKIQNAVLAATRAYGSLDGWQSILYPKGSYALFNVPISATMFEQHVVNTQTGAWCRFKGMNGACWAIYNDSLYFGGTDGTVRLADTGSSDSGAAITFDCLPAFSYFGSKGQKKLFTMCRPLISSNGPLALAIDINVDFQIIAPTSIPTTPAINAMVWGTSLWGQANWGGESLVAPWLTVTGLGFCASPRIRGSTNSLSVSFAAYDMVWQPGSVL
jgi:hypothetical protein